MFTSGRIYSKDSLGSIRVWSVEVEGDKWRTVSGLIDGKHVTSAWTVVVPKNVGRSNEKSGYEQAMAEAYAELDKKLARDYRKTIEELDTVPVAPMLAQDYAKQKNIKFPLWSQPKLDGIRCISFKHGSFTREFKPHMNIEHIRKALEPLFARYPDLILDGELYNHELHDDFNQITSIVRKSKNISADDRALSEKLVQYHVYDKITDQDFSVRTKEIAAILENMQPYIQIVKSTYVETQEQLDLVYGEYTLNNYEGQIVRADKGGYDAGKRSKLLLKRKQFDTDEFKLLAINPGIGNWAGYAKTCTVELKDGSTNDSGMRGNQAFAKNILENSSMYIGGTVTVRYFGYTPDGKLRFPVIIDFQPNGRVD